MTEHQEGFEAGDRDEFNLVEPYDMVVAAHHGTVRLRLIFPTNQTRLPAGTFYGCEMTPSEARMIAAHMIREAELAEKDGE